MKLTLDTTAKLLIQEVNGKSRKIDLYSREAFELISNQWVKIGWDQKYTYTFTWMGRPIIQLPEDMVRIQEVIYQVKPDVIIETGVAQGGSLIYYASLFKVIGKGRVIGIDVEIRPHNRKAIESHKMFPRITLIEGSSTDTEVVNHVKSLIKPKEVVLIILDSCHTKQHVLEELETYCDLVTRGSYIVATDGIMKELYDVPRGNSEWAWNNPVTAVEEFVKKHTEFIIESPEFLFNEGMTTKRITYWPVAYLKRK